MDSIEKDFAYADAGVETINDTAAHTNNGEGYSGFQVVGGDAVINTLSSGGAVCPAFTGVTVKDSAVYTLPIDSITRTSGGSLIAFKKRPI